jgi:lysophospholipase L1-like esterase
MNSNKRVLYFVTVSVVIYLLISVTAELFDFRWKPFNNVNLVSALFKPKPKPKSKPATIKINHLDTSVKIEKKPGKDFSLYTQPGIITNFNGDTTQSSLINFCKKLYALKSGNKRKIRIAYFGDSMIEGDLLTQTFRKLLQQEFGGYGVGFVPITSLISRFRSTVYANFSDGWEDQNFKTASNSRNLFFSGHLFYGNNDWVEMRDQTMPGNADALEKSLLCGYAKTPVSVKLYNIPISFSAKEKFNRIVLNANQKRNIRITVSDSLLPVYGISFESASGITVDNFSFRGITGIELDKTDTALLRDIAASNSYDLFIFEYGVNLLFRPNDTDFKWYGRVMASIIKKIKKYFTDADILLISTADRAFRYDGEYASAIGIDSLVKVQANTAFETGASFYNLFETMGGHNSIIKWADATPPMARVDYVHPNAKGVDTLATYLFESMMNDYNKYVNHLK